MCLFCGKKAHNEQETGGFQLETVRPEPVEGQFRTFARGSTDKTLTSTLRVKGAVSDLSIKALFGNRNIEMSVSLVAPQDKGIRGQLGWIRKQMEHCHKKSDDIFSKIVDNIRIDILLKRTNKFERISVNNLSEVYNDIRDREIKSFRIVLIKDFGKTFSSRQKFVETIEKMLVDYYKGLVQYLKKWEPLAPRIQDDKRKSPDVDYDGVQ